jgi:hypothetical protein
LKDPISQKRGFGPVCWGNVISSKEREKNQGRLFNDPELPFTGDIILQRDGSGGIMTNVSRNITQHSLAGFEWGYGGSGPADLALNILAMFTDQKTAEELHQVFKWDYIAKLPHEGGTIKGRDVKRWLRQHRKEVS